MKRERFQWTKERKKSHAEVAGIYSEDKAPVCGLVKKEEESLLGLLSHLPRYVFGAQRVRALS